MEYVTGIHALNVECSLNTSGDWHTSAIQWYNPTTAMSSTSLLGDWGIETGIIPQEDGTLKQVYKANHLRAILDILCGITNLKPTDIKFFKRNWICTDEYDRLFIAKVDQLHREGAIEDWETVNQLMAKEFGRLWTRRGTIETGIEPS